MQPVTSAIVDELAAPARSSPLQAAARRTSAAGEPAITGCGKSGAYTPEGERPQPAPTIQVTIGRIEVRATPGQPQAAEPRPPAGPSRLEAYLRQRNGGRR